MSLDEAKLKNVLNNLVEQVKKGECILFLGASVHAPPPKDSKYDYPEELRPLQHNKIAKKLAEACDFKKVLPNESELDLQRVSLCYQLTKGFGRSKLVNFLQKHVQEGKKSSPALEMLAAMPFRIVITTNYDRLFEQALTKHDKDPHKFVYEPEPSENRATPDLKTEPTKERPMLFKMHGDLDNRESIVVTDEDYINFVQRMSDKGNLHPVPHTIQYRMRKWPILFIGYSLRDYNLRLLFRTLRWKIDPANFPESFSIDYRPDPLILQVWQNERRFVTFLTENLWTFVPLLYEAVIGEECPT